jgi:hypothetical protein
MFIELKENSFGQIIDCPFKQCSSNEIDVSNPSEFHATRCQFLNMHHEIIRTYGESQILFQNINPNKESLQECSLYFKPSKGIIMDSHFSKIKSGSISAPNNKTFIKKCIFENGQNNQIWCNQSLGKITTWQFKNISNTAIKINYSSKVNIDHSSFEACDYGISGWSSSEGFIICCFFGLNKNSIFSTGLSKIELDNCILNDPEEISLWSNGGNIKVNSSKIIHSSSSTSIFLIDDHGGLSMMDTTIRWDSLINYQTDFEEANFAEIQNVSINQNILENFKLTVSTEK